MRQITIHRNFENWRKIARRLLIDAVPPEQVMWTDADAPTLLPVDDDSESLPASAALTVPRNFMSIARLAACHRNADRWPLLYRMLWRLTHGEPELLERITDDDVHELLMMEKAVRRDRHKMTAFVRFRRVESEAGEHYIAWHRPDHFIVKLTAPFFSERFASMRWTILTPDDSVSWDGHSLCFSAGVPASAASQKTQVADDLEELWKTYYANIFNPARIKLNAMRKEMPVRHWATLPETQIIPDLLRDAPRRVEEMVNKSNAIAKPSGENAFQKGGKESGCPTAASAAEFLPARIELPQLIAAAKHCQGCSIYCNATQTVFGEGPANAKLMMVGEQPGDQEDLAGRPFVGPAGQLLDRVMQQVGLPRDQIYVTNAVKHFKWEPGDGRGGKRRLHSKPSSREVAACHPWLEAEIAALKPTMIVALGATAAQSLFGNGFRVTQHRGQPVKSDHAPWCMATIHPSALLRTPDDQREAAIAEFAADLKKAANHLKSL
jgi:probable DNA metabolism protein